MAKRRASILPFSEVSTSHDTPSDNKSEKSSSTIASTVTLSSRSSFDEKSYDSLSDSFSPTQNGTPVKSKVSAKPISDKDRPKELPNEFVMPTKFGKITDSNLEMYFNICRLLRIELQPGYFFHSVTKEGKIFLRL